MKSVADFSRRRFLANSGGAAVAAAGSALGVAPAWAAAPVKMRSFSELLSRQGTYCASDGNGGCQLFVPPVPNFLGFSTRFAGRDTALFAGVDYAGLANAYYGGMFGTQVGGTVMEQALPDGRADVRVHIFTNRANSWVIELDLKGDTNAQIASKPTLFGRRPNESGPYALSQCSMEVRFINSAPGAPLPDLLQLINFPDGTGEATFLGFTSQGSGPLHAGFGVAEGSPGRCIIRQTGLLGTYLKAASKSRVGLDAFPAELIQLNAVGR